MPLERSRDRGTMEGGGNVVTREPARRAWAAGDYETATRASARGTGIAALQRALGRVVALNVIREEITRALEYRNRVANPLVAVEHYQPRSRPVTTIYTLGPWPRERGGRTLSGTQQLSQGGAAIDQASEQAHGKESASSAASTRSVGRIVALFAAFLVSLTLAAAASADVSFTKAYGPQSIPMH